MHEPKPRLTIEMKGNVSVIRFNDRNILDEASIQSISDEILRHIDSLTNPRILIDFSNVDHLSSSALGSLITINNRVRKHDGQLRLSNIGEQIMEVFTITKLNKLFQIHPSHKSALDSFQ